MIHHRLNISLTALAALLLLVTGCPNAPKQEADAFVEKYYSWIKEKNYDEILNNCSEHLLGIATRDEIISVFAIVNERLGEIESYEQSEWEVYSYLGTAEPNGTTYSYIYTVQYTNGGAQEEIEVFFATGTTIPQLNKYYVNSPALAD